MAGTHVRARTNCAYEPALKAGQLYLRDRFRAGWVRNGRETLRDNMLPITESEPSIPLGCSAKWPLVAVTSIKWAQFVVTSLGHRPSIRSGLMAKCGYLRGYLPASEINYTSS